MRDSSYNNPRRFGIHKGLVNGLALLIPYHIMTKNSSPDASSPDARVGDRFFLPFIFFIFLTDSRCINLSQLRLNSSGYRFLKGNVIFKQLISGYKISV